MNIDEVERPRWFPFANIELTEIWIKANNLTFGTMAHRTKNRAWAGDSVQAQYFLLRDGRAGVLEDQGDKQAQEDACKARYHPEASSADELAGDEQPAQGQNRSKDRDGGGNDPHNTPALGGEHQKQHENKSVSQQKLGH